MRVEEVKLTASGKAYSVKLSNGKYYVADLRSGIEQTAGKEIEPTFGAFKAPNGATVATIEGFTLVEPSKAPAANPGGSNGHSDRWWLNFVSNQCGQAILSGVVKDADSLRQWAVAAKLAVVAADGAGEDSLPF